MMRWLRKCAFAAAMMACLAMGYGAGVSRRSNESSGAIPPSVHTTDPIAQFRSERMQLRQQQISSLNEIVHGETRDEEITVLAQRRLMKLLEWTEVESTLEGILKLREYEDVVVTVHGDSVNVLVSAESLEPQQTATILELVCRETGISAGNVKIIPIN